MIKPGDILILRTPADDGDGEVIVQRFKVLVVKAGKPNLCMVALESVEIKSKDDAFAVKKGS